MLHGSARVVSDKRAPLNNLRARFHEEIWDVLDTELEAGLGEAVLAQALPGEPENYQDRLLRQA